jgi:NlpC/P60 family putative phage cell wall peptidase
MSLARARIVAAARGWIGTPYQHQASARGAGADRLGLVRGIWREFIGPEPETLSPYSPDWSEAGGSEALANAMARWLAQRPVARAGPGDVILFRMDAGSPMKHAAILTGPDEIVHAYWARAVVASRFSPWWRRRAAAAFSFPGVQIWPN